jgi:nucleoside-diphosphate-sugar epimerase
MKTRQRTVAITGASGFLGSRLVEYYLQQGWRVVALVRQPEDFGILGVQTKSYGISEELSPQLLKNVDCLVHAALLRQTPDVHNALKQNISAAKRLLKNAAANGVKRAVFISSMSASKAAVSVYGKQKFAIEKLFYEAGYSSVRPGLIIGNGGIVKDMVDFMRRMHAVPLVDGGSQPLQYIAIDDVCAGVYAAGNLSKPSCITLAHPTVYSYRELYSVVRRQLNLRAVFIPIPSSVLVLCLVVAEKLRIPLSISRDNLLGLKALEASDNQACLEALGLHPMPIEKALMRMVDEAKK